MDRRRPDVPGGSVVPEPVHPPPSAVSPAVGHDAASGGYWPVGDPPYGEGNRPGEQVDVLTRLLLRRLGVVAEYGDTSAARARALRVSATLRIASLHYTTAVNDAARLLHGDRS